MNIYINGNEVVAKPKQTIMQAAHQAGIYIPYFCWHPQLSISGSCRICFVEIVGERGNILRPACATEVSEGMKILIDSEKVLTHRQSVMEILLLNHPVDCGVCDKAGECLLQDYHYAHNGQMSKSLEAKDTDTKFHQLSERIVLDNERCILCSRCVRFTAEVSKTHGLGIINRGGHSQVREDPDGTFNNDPYSDNVIDLCPVGALLAKNFMYQSRVWYIKPTKSVCPGCAQGCEVKIWSRKNSWKLNAPLTASSECAENKQKIYRVTPLHQNIENRPNNSNLTQELTTPTATEATPWICNIGRDLGQFYNQLRGQTPLCKGSAITINTAITNLSQLLNAAKNPVILVTNWASNEELKALASLPAKLQRVFKVERFKDECEIDEDSILIRADKNPNTAGVRANVANLVEKIPEGCDLLIIWGVYQLGFNLVSEQNKLAGAKIVVLSPFVNPENGHADVYIPISLPTERNGSWTNGAGKSKNFEKLFTKDVDVTNAEDLFKNLSSLVKGN